MRKTAVSCSKSYKCVSMEKNLQKRFPFSPKMDSKDIIFLHRYLDKNFSIFFQDFLITCLTPTCRHSCLTCLLRHADIPVLPYLLQYAYILDFLVLCKHNHLRNYLCCLRIIVRKRKEYLTAMLRMYRQDNNHRTTGFMDNSAS